MSDFYTYIQYGVEMKKTIFFVILLLSGLITIAQSELSLFNIRGEKVEIPNSVQPVVIFYTPYSCHNCMYDLINYMEKMKQVDSRFELYVMIPGRDAATMRYATTGLDEFFSKSNMPRIVYDLNKDTKLRYETRYDVKQYPCLFVFDMEGECQYLSYHTLFMEGASMNKKINDIIKGF